VNVKGPFCLASHGIKVIQISTDCVFNGEQGPYYEDTPPNAEDLYGKTKAQGELQSPHLTVRLSFVGLGKRGLLHWLLNQKGSVSGYRRVLWNGMTAPVAGRRIVESADKTGTLHLHGDDMSKHDLLSMANDVFGLGLTVNPVDEPVSDMRLRSHYSNGRPPDFREQLEELRRYR
jgi:dTDP-4-dehydrorhamnose reductase